jgi:hypothetical protein
VSYEVIDGPDKDISGYSIHSSVSPKILDDTLKLMHISK